MSISGMATARIRVEFEDKFSKESSKALAEFKKKYLDMSKALEENGLFQIPKVSNDSGSEKTVLDTALKWLGAGGSLAGIAGFFGKDSKNLGGVVEKFSAQRMAGAGLANADKFVLPGLASATPVGLGLTTMGCLLSQTQWYEDMQEKAKGFFTEEKKQEETQKKKQANLEAEKNIREEILTKKRSGLEVEQNIVARNNESLVTLQALKNEQASVEAMDFSVRLKDGDKLLKESADLRAEINKIFSKPVFQEVKIRQSGSVAGSLLGDGFSLLQEETGGLGQSVSEQAESSNKSSKGLPGPAGSGGPVSKLAKGADFIPYDNFPASLHKGEAVLPSDVAEQYRRGARGRTINIDKFNVEISGNNKRPEDLARELYFHLKRIEQHIDESVF